MPEPVSLFTSLVVSALLLISVTGTSSIHSMFTLGSPLIDIPTTEPVITATPVKVAQFTNTFALPLLSARAFYIQDANTGQVLLEKNPDTKELPASTTKIMTALVALEDYRLDEIVTVGRAGEAVGHTAELVVGEQLLVQDLLKALLINSGNDAAVALALHHPGGYQRYVDRMNQIAEQLNLKNTHFTNVSGIEGPNHYVSAKDLAIITAFALKNTTFKNIVATPSTTINSIDGRYQHYLQNINQLLTAVTGVEGVKTGWTPNAKECLVTYINRDGNQIIVVVLGSDDRFGESEILIEWTFANHQWIEELQDQLDIGAVST